MADFQFLPGLAGIDHQEVMGYFERYGEMARYEAFDLKQPEANQP
jgi:hypothetical protein